MGSLIFQKGVNIVFPFANHVQWCRVLVYNGCTLFYTESEACVVGTLKLIWQMNVMITNLTNDFK